MSLESIIFCKMCEKSDRKRDEGLTIPSTVEYIRDIRYATHSKYHLLDICFPKKTNGQKVLENKIKLPVIVSVHGGGYVYGSKEVYQYYSASLSEHGFVVINFNYRLAPKYKFPAPLEDLTDVLSWITRNQNDYPIDVNNVFLVGDSAGAQIVSQYGAIYSNEEYCKIMQLEIPDVKIRALGLCCGTYDLKKRIIEEGKRGILKDYLTRNTALWGTKLDVLEAINQDYPPSYLFSAEGDFLKEECRPMAEWLASKGVICEYKIYGTEQTGHVFHVDMRNEFGVVANNEQIAFFKRFIN